MPLLSAKFVIEEIAPCLLSWPDEDNPRIELTLRGFQVSAALLVSPFRRWKEKDDVHWTKILSGLVITVSRDEPDTPPDAIINPDGTRDLVAQGKYLLSKSEQYRSVALDVGNRILQYFQYSMLTPFVRMLPSWVHSLNNPEWFGANGLELRGRPMTIVAEPIPGQRGEFGTKKLGPAELPDLLSYISAPTKPTLSEELLSDAQTAWYEGNFRRSVLELAICTELLVKRRYFEQVSPAGAAFDYLEDKGKISVRVLDLLGAVAEEVFARSYKNQEPNNYKHIENLLRCRNKIAHRGELTFRNDSGKTVNVDASHVQTWWRAVENLREWLASL
jgi:hypothetical protein